MEGMEGRKERARFALPGSFTDRTEKSGTGNVLGTLRRIPLYKGKKKRKKRTKSIRETNPNALWSIDDVIIPKKEKKKK